MAISAIIDRVHDALEQLGTDCPMEDVTALCPDLTWNQVFLAVDYLSRSGQIRVTLDAGNTYRVEAHRRESERLVRSTITQVGRGAKN
jgi:hypothetical protein